MTTQTTPNYRISAPARRNPESRLLEFGEIEIDAYVTGPKHRFIFTLNGEIFHVFARWQAEAKAIWKQFAAGEGRYLTPGEYVNGEF